MVLKTKVYDDIGVISLKGKMMGFPFTEEMNNEVRRLILKNIKKIILDLHEVAKINSSGIGAIIVSFSALKDIGGELCVARLSDKVMDVMDITDMFKIFEAFDTVEEAIKKLQFQ